MKPYGLLFAVLASACASATPPGEMADASAADAPGKKDASIDAPNPEGPNLCATSETCAGAMMLGSVNGDANNMKLSANGYQSAWFRVRVLETDSEILGISLRVASKLTFPAGVGFETYVYLNPGSDVPAECAITTGTRSTVGNVQTVKAEWGETGPFSNGSDDDRNVTIEVRPIGTNCSMSATWQLEIEGNWN